MSFYVAALHHRTGDVIFSRDRDLLSRIIRIGHLPIDRKPGRFSHVTMCAFPGLFVDSVPSDGVRLFDVEQKSNDCVRFHRILTSRPVVLRFPPEILSTDKILESIAYWTGQEYSFRYIRSLGAKHGAAFCSQFVAQVFAHAGIDFGGRPLPLYITPSALYERMESAGAIDVTELYVKFDQMLKDRAGDPTAFADDLPRAAIRMRLMQAIGMAMASNISESTSVSVIKQQLATSNALVDGRYQEGAIYGPIHKALDGRSYALMAFSLLGRPSKSRHWVEGPTGEDKAQLREIVTGCFQDCTHAVQYLQHQIRLIEAETQAVLASLQNDHHEAREARAIRCSNLLAAFSDEEEEKVEKSFREALHDVSFSRTSSRATVDGMQPYLEIVEEAQRGWQHFKERQLELRKSFIRLVTSLEDFDDNAI